MDNERTLATALLSKHRPGDRSTLKEKIQCPSNGFPCRCSPGVVVVVVHMVVTLHTGRQVKHRRGGNHFIYIPYTEISHRDSCATHCDGHIITRSQIVQKVQDSHAEFSHGRLVVVVVRTVIIFYTGSGGQVIK